MTRDRDRHERPTVIYDGGTGSHRPGAVGFEELGQPRLPHQLVYASVAAALILTGSAVGTVAAIDVNPTAFAVFESPPRSADEEAGIALASRGAAVIGVPRVLESGSVTIAAAFAPEGTGELLVESFGYAQSAGNRPPDPDDLGVSDGRLVVPASAEICLWSIPPEGTPRGRCSSIDSFVDVGLAVAYDAQTLESIAVWNPDGSVALQQIPRGPTSIEELRALDSPVLARLEGEPRDSEEERAAGVALDPFVSGETVVPPRAIAATNDWLMAAGVYQPAPGAGLVMCVTVVTALAELDGQSGACPAVVDVVENGVAGEADVLGQAVPWGWTPAGVVLFGGERL